MAKSFSQIKQRSTYRHFKVLDDLGIPHGTSLPTVNTETSRASIFVLVDAVDATKDKIYTYDTITDVWNPLPIGTGANGKSAYELAVINGFTGTESQWLATLNGTGGKSAYQLWLEVPNVGTVDDYLQSLKGSNGVGIPSGGTTGQVLAKRTNNDFETEWHNESGFDDSAIITALGNKVDKIPGYGLSQENYTPAEKAKLAGMEGSKFKGYYPNKAALDAANVGGEGHYADVDAGIGADVARWIWDVNDDKWVLQQGTSTAETAASIKAKYESNPDTNAFTDLLKTNLETAYGWGNHASAGYLTGLPLDVTYMGMAFNGPSQLLQLRADNKYPALDGSLITNLPGGGGIWGAITGTIANQTDLQGVLDLKADLVSGKVPVAQLPSYVDDVIEGNYINSTNFKVDGIVITPETGKIYIDVTSNNQYRWGGSTFIELTASPGTTDAVPEGTTNLYFTVARVLATVLTGLSVLVGGDIIATDSILIAFGKIQYRFTDLLTTFNVANKLVKLDGAGKLPAIDGSQLTNLPAAGATIDDVIPSLTKAYSSQKTQNEIDSLSAQITANAGNDLFNFYNFS